MKKMIFILGMLSATHLFAQPAKKQDQFFYEICKVKGDLNGDKIADVVIVTQDTIDDKRPYRLQIFFAEPNGKLKLIVSTTKAIKAEFPDGSNSGYRTGNEFDQLTIKKEVLGIKIALLRGQFEHKFRFQNGNFELIGYSHIAPTGDGSESFTDFNLVTGIRIEKEVPYDTTLPVHAEKKKIMIRPLPKLTDFKPFTNLLYY